MSAPHPMAHEMFYKIALEYYVNGRAACLSGCVLITGNLLHHAVKMILKAELSRTAPLDDLKKTFGHSLPECWNAFKALFRAEDLTEFDSMITELDKFEDIRYPDKLLGRGASIGFGFGHWWPSPGTTAKPVPQYAMGIGHVDAFFARIFQLSHIIPKAYFGFLQPEWREALLKYNDEAKDWLS